MLLGLLEMGVFVIPGPSGDGVGTALGWRLGTKEGMVDGISDGKVPAGNMTLSRIWITPLHACTSVAVMAGRRFGRLSTPT
jgi:hypothetical protein